MHKKHFILMTFLIASITGGLFFFLGRTVERDIQEDIQEDLLQHQKEQIIYEVKENTQEKKENCRPSVDKDAKNFVVGYGSLMNKESRMITVPDAAFAAPVLVKNYERIWASRGTKSKATYLLAVPQKDYIMNAIYYPTKADDILSTDLREASYCRVKIDDKDLIPVGINRLPKGNYWMYVKKFSEAEFPNQEFPILQSYADVFLAGCLQTQSEFNLTEFGKLCFTTTYNWDLANWVYDRSNPQYARYSDNTVNYKNQIDSIISRRGLDTPEK